MAECNVSHSVETLSRHYLTPKEMLQALTAIGQYKAAARWYKTLWGGILAGCYIMLGGLLSVSTAGGIDPDIRDSSPSVVALAAGLTFWVGLLLIMVTGGELFTGNVMYLLLARINGRCTNSEMLKNWAIVYLGNIIGATGGGIFFAYLGDMYSKEPYLSFLQAVAVKKCTQSFGVIFVRGIGANWLVCSAICFVVASQDQISRIASVFVPIMAFVVMGFEHCVANMFYVPVGMVYGADVTVEMFIVNNLIPSTLGNFIGGALICGLGLHFLHVFEPTQTTVQEKPAASADMQRLLTQGEADLLNPELRRLSVFPFVKRYVCADGQVIRVRVSPVVVLDKVTQNPLKIISKIRLLSSDGAIKDTEDAVSDAEGLLVLFWNGTGAVEDCEIIADAKLSHMLGYSSSKLAGMRLKQVTYAEDSSASTTNLSQAIQPSMTRMRKQSEDNVEAETLKLVV